LTLTLDYTHFAYLGLPDSEVEPLLTYASHFHVRGAQKGRLQASLANNVIDYGRSLDDIFELDQLVRVDPWYGPVPDFGHEVIAEPECSLKQACQPCSRLRA